MPLPNYERVLENNEKTKQQQELAYQKWEQAGCPQGRDLEFWLEAEKELGQDNES